MKHKSIAITGSSGYIGTKLLFELEKINTSNIVAIDKNPPLYPIRNMTTIQTDINKDLSEPLESLNVNTLIHLAFDMRWGKNLSERNMIIKNNLDGLKKILISCRNAKVKNFIYLSSQSVYGAYKNNPNSILESHNLNPNSGFQYAENKTKCESFLEEFSRINTSSNPNITILRSAIVLGPNKNPLFNKVFSPQFSLKVLTKNPPFQFIHEDDLSKLIVSFIKNPLEGTFNVAADGVVFYKEIVRKIQKKYISLPGFFTTQLIRVSNVVNKTGFPVSAINFMKFPIMLTTAKLKKFSQYKLKYSSAEALESFIGTNLS